MDDPIERYVARLVDAAPKITDEQLARLRSLVGQVLPERRPEAFPRKAGLERADVDRN